ncbi:MAG: hypothetical protein ACI840_001837 [Ulvibacter sp.]|jgi:hypothetical protein
MFLLSDLSVYRKYLSGSTFYSISTVLLTVLETKSSLNNIIIVIFTLQKGKNAQEIIARWFCYLLYFVYL